MAFWGLEEGQQYERSLYALRVTRGGHMRHQPMRETIIRDVKERVA
jgi:hypothetical protein